MDTVMACYEMRKKSWTISFFFIVMQIEIQHCSFFIVMCKKTATKSFFRVELQCHGIFEEGWLWEANQAKAWKSKSKIENLFLTAFELWWWFFHFHSMSLSSNLSCSLSDVVDQLFAAIFFCTSARECERMKKCRIDKIYSPFMLFLCI